MNQQGAPPAAIVGRRLLWRHAEAADGALKAAVTVIVRLLEHLALLARELLHKRVLFHVAGQQLIVLPARGVYEPRAVDSQIPLHLTVTLNGLWKLTHTPAPAVYEPLRHVLSEGGPHCFLCNTAYEPQCCPVTAAFFAILLC
jgi:hypothetical protein